MTATVICVLLFLSIIRALFYTVTHEESFLELLAAMVVYFVVYLLSFGIVILMMSA